MRISDWSSDVCSSDLVHERRKRYPDQRDPLKLVAEEYATEVRVLCFDEFFVSDIADAMILGRLFENLFGLGVTLRSEEHTSELQSLMRISYAVFCLKKKNT